MLGALIIIAGILWAGAFYLLGMHALTFFKDAGERSPLDVTLWLGIFLLLGANFVFMELVASRVVRIERRGLLDATELITAAGMILAVGVFVSMWLLRMPTG